VVGMQIDRILAGRRIGGTVPELRGIGITDQGPVTLGHQERPAARQHSSILATVSAVDRGTVSRSRCHAGHGGHRWRQSLRHPAPLRRGSPVATSGSRDALA
jgi:hypothetical protein